MQFVAFLNDIQQVKNTYSRHQDYEMNISANELEIKFNIMDFV